MSNKDFIPNIINDTSITRQKNLWIKHYEIPVNMSLEDKPHTSMVQLYFDTENCDLLKNHIYIYRKLYKNTDINDQKNSLVLQIFLSEDSYIEITEDKNIAKALFHIFTSKKLKLPRNIYNPLHYICVKIANIYSDRFFCSDKKEACIYYWYQGIKIGMYYLLETISNIPISPSIPTQLMTIDEKSNVLKPNSINACLYHTKYNICKNFSILSKDFALLHDSSLSHPIIIENAKDNIYNKICPFPQIQNTFDDTINDTDSDNDNDINLNIDKKIFKNTVNCPDSDDENK